LTSRAVEHGIEAYGLRASADGRSLAYSGDCTHVTHVGPTLTPEAATARAAGVFGGPTVTAIVGHSEPW
jgi:hypothetical protein